MTLKRPVLWKEMLAALGLFVFLGMACYYVAYRPVSRKAASLGAEVEKLRDEASGYRTSVAGAKNEAGRLEEAVSAYERMKEEFESVMERLPTADAVSGIIREIASPYPGISFVLVQPSAIEDKGNYLRLPVSIQARGNFPSLGRFLTRLEGLKRLITINNVTITKDAQSGLLIRLDISVYLMPKVQS